MPGPLMTVKEASKRYHIRLKLPDDTIVYHRGKKVFSIRDEHRDKEIVAGSVKNKIGEPDDPYAHTSDEPRINKRYSSSSVKMRGIRKGWSTWETTKDRDEYKKKMKPIHVSKNKPNAKKSRKEHVRKKPRRKAHGK